MDEWLNNLNSTDEFDVAEQNNAALHVREMPGLRIKGGALVHALLADSVGDVSSVGATVEVCSRKRGPRAIVDTPRGARLMGHKEFR